MISLSRLTRASCALALVLASAAAGAQTKRRHAATAPQQQKANGTVTITGTVTDATTGAPVTLAHVGTALEGRQYDAEVNASGQYTLTIPNATTVLTVTRATYVPTQQTYRPSGTTTINFSMPRTPTIVVRLTTGDTFELDYNTSKFGYSIPFSGNAIFDAPPLCVGDDKVAFEPLKSSIRRITAPRLLTGTACCPERAALAVDVELKSGAQSTGTFVDSCVGYDMIFLGIERSTALAKFIEFKSIAEITFP